MQTHICQGGFQIRDNVVDVGITWRERKEKKKKRKKDSATDRTQGLIISSGHQKKTIKLTTMSSFCTPNYKTVYYNYDIALASVWFEATVRWNFYSS